MAQDMPPKGGYQPVQYKVSELLVERLIIWRLRQQFNGARPGRQMDSSNAIRRNTKANYLSSVTCPPRVSVLESSSSEWVPSWATAGTSSSTAFAKPSTTFSPPDFTQCHIANRFSSELAREKMWARINLIPLLQAEEDRDQVRRYLADQKREKELLGENTKVYHNDRLVNQADTLIREQVANNCIRFVRPTFAVSPAPSK